jgi:hypothetical protein
MSRGPGKTMRIVHEALIKAEGGWRTINELVEIAYPEYATWQQREVHRFAVRKAVAALQRDWVEGVRVVRDGNGSNERARADLTEWTGRHLKTPPKRDRRPRQPPPTYTPRRRPSKVMQDDARDWIGLPAVDDAPNVRPAELRGRVAPCHECKCPDFLSGGFPGECRRCGHLDTDHM